jgi:hypothetical protein
MHRPEIDVPIYYCLYSRILALIFSQFILRSFRISVLNTKSCLPHSQSSNLPSAEMPVSMSRTGLILRCTNASRAVLLR